MASMHERMEKYKRVVRLRLCGWTPAEIRARVGGSKANVHNLIHEAVRLGDLPHPHRICPPELTDEELRAALDRERAATRAA